MRANPVVTGLFPIRPKESGVNQTTLAGFRVATWLCRPVRMGPRAETGLDSVILSIPPKTGSRRVRESVPLASCFSHRSGLFLPSLPKTYGFRGGGAHA